MFNKRNLSNYSYFLRAPKFHAQRGVAKYLLCHILVYINLICIIDIKHVTIQMQQNICFFVDKMFLSNYHFSNIELTNGFRTLSNIYWSFYVEKS